MLHAGLDLSRRRLDVCLIGDDGDVVGRLAAPPDADGLRHLSRAQHRPTLTAAVPQFHPVDCLRPQQDRGQGVPCRPGAVGHRHAPLVQPDETGEVFG